MPRPRARVQDRTDELLRRLATEHELGQPELVAEILDRLRDTVPEFFADEDVAYDMHAAVTANVARVHHLLVCGPATAGSDGVPIEAADLLQSTIQHGIPLISLLEAYRAAQGLAVDWWQRRLEHDAPPGLLAPATRTLSKLILTYIDAAAVLIRASYEEQRRTLDASPDGRRAHLIRRLLAGEPLDIDAAARTLGHPLSAHHVALVVSRDDHAAVQPDFAEVLSSIAHALGTVRTLTMPETRRRTYAWLSTSGRLDLTALRVFSIPAGVRVATSGVHRGIEGFVQSHLDAVRTASVMRDQRTSDRVAIYEQVELVALLSRDPDDRDRFVRRVLGPIASTGADAERARQTLRVFLASGSSPSRTAKQLGIHRNTVTYRLNTLAGVVLQPNAGSIEADWENATAQRLEVELALHIIEQLGPLPRAGFPPESRQPILTRSRRSRDRASQLTGEGTVR
jgi:DNA-binding PucR family transcriptional regulator